MKLWTLFIVGFSLCLVSVLIVGGFLQTEYFDYSMLIGIIVYFVPILFISGINALFLTYVESKTKKPKLNILAGFLPVIILASTLFFDDSVLFMVGLFGAIPILITNVIWNWKLIASVQHCV